MGLVFSSPCKKNKVHPVVDPYYYLPVADNNLDECYKDVYNKTQTIKNKNT